ncbi:MAG: NAD(P)H-dependent flavin oxidoreductase [Actinomycetota bacterium]
MKTPLTELLGIEHPILSAGMGAATGPELAAAVSNAGACGQVTITGLSAPNVHRRVEETRALTAKPFGVNVILADREEGEDEDIRAALELGVPLLVLFWGDPSPFVQEAHRRGTKVFVQVGSVEEAVAAAGSGVDGVIAQGFEAGGHVRGSTALFVLLPAVVDAVSPVPVIAAGGIADGRGLAAALTLGAQGVLMGTRFLASDEAFVPREYRDWVVRSTAEDTVYSKDLFDVWWPDAPHRVLRNKGVEEWEAAGRPPPGGRPGEATVIGSMKRMDGSVVDVPRYCAITITPNFEGDIDKAPLWAGQSCSLVNEVKPAGEIVRDVARQAEAILARPTANQ